MSMRVDRRTTIKWVLTAAAMPRLQRTASAESARGYGMDPDLLRIYSPGELWPLTLAAQQRVTAATLCDVVIPADAHSPSASAVGVVDFIDEWISAPYPRQQQDRELILTGLKWIEDEAHRRYSKVFAALSAAEHVTICGQICYAPQAPAPLAAPAAFFGRYRDLTAAGFYTTPAGRKDLQYVGNVALATFEGPPREVLEAVGLNGIGEIQ